MKSDGVFFAELAASFLPFVLFAFLNGKANVKKGNRHRQYAMPVIAVVYGGGMFLFLNRLAALCMDTFLKLADLFEKVKVPAIADWVRSLHASWGIYLELVLFNTAVMLMYLIVKRIMTAFFGRIEVSRNSLVGTVVELFYTYDELENRWYIKEHYGQACTWLKTVYYGSCLISGLALLISCVLCKKDLVLAPFYPVFAVIIMGEMAFFVDGFNVDERKSELSMQADQARHVALYPLLRRPLRSLFGDKLSAEGTTVHHGGMTGGAIEDILVGLEKDGGHIGKHYAAWIRKKMERGLRTNVDYVRCGYDLAVGKSLLFNTPFYDKLNPYVFYAMNRELLTGGKVLIVLGRHGTEENLQKWTQSGMQAVSNIPDLWKVEVLSGKKVNEEEPPDVGILPCSGVHDLDIHKNNIPFLRRVSFVFLVEPSRLVTTAQIGLNLLIKCCGKERAITFCSVDRNCDGLVDALSHILMTNVTEVSATEHPHGMSSYMYWTADDDYLQHRILPGVSRYLGMGTELSMVALKNQVKKTVWYGGEAFPVLDARWIAKQYYYDLLDYAQLPTNQETFDQCFQTSFNLCDERVSTESFITVEDDRNNLFETRRNFATVAEEQGFVNVISSEYMLREYMSDNTEVFTADAKAIPYITADYARTKRNAILSVCLLLCVNSVQKESLRRQMVMLNMDTEDPATEIWKEICAIFSEESFVDKHGYPVLAVQTRSGESVRFEKETTILFKRVYSVESGRFESVYTIENADFSHLILDDLQNASYIAEQESKDIYLGSELKGHVYQKYMPGQFFTLNGKYYEMVSTTADNRILVRRAADHIGGRLAYRQVRHYMISHMVDSPDMGMLKTVNNIDIHYQYADFTVETPGYWKLHAYHDFDNGDLVKVNGVPTREYHQKQILKFDFSKLGEGFTDSVRMTLTNLLNEVFVTLFADNRAFISAVTPGSYEAPLTYSLAFGEKIQNAEKCIFIIEDSQLDIGLLIAVERNVKRIFQIISDYLAWNDEQIEESIRRQNAPVAEKTESIDVYAEEAPQKRKLMERIADWFRNLFKKKDERSSENRIASGQEKRKERAAEKATARAEKKAARERKKAQKQEEKNHQELERETRATEDSFPEEGAAETTTEAERDEEKVDSAEEMTIEKPTEEAVAEMPERVDGETEVSENA